MESIEHLTQCFEVIIYSVVPMRNAPGKYQLIGDEIEEIITKVIFGGGLQEQKYLKIRSLSGGRREMTRFDFAQRAAIFYYQFAIRT